MNSDNYLVIGMLLLLWAITIIGLIMHVKSFPYVLIILFPVIFFSAGFIQFMKEELV